ncbi:uncharacterized protein LOC120292670 [Eucalyptus grandis]|uniref:uncharacterized protein LOC120292670 n=1 Tax=Eucalyptus grandis TaxID=71139 RepID=UPI00192EA59D|nr:uncharacterized protein LOC120292670 [Eucalyptus grandis]
METIMEPLTPQTEPIVAHDPIVETVPDEIPHAPRIQNEIDVAPLRRSTRERRSAIPPDYLVYLGEHDYDIGYVVDLVTYTEAISCTHVADPPGKETAGEAPSVTPIIVNLDPPPKENPAPRLSEESERCLAKMEERLCALQGYELKGADRLSPYTKTNFPKNFQEPEFTRKYDGTGCPKTHLRYYMRKMARYADNVPFLIHTFQDSLEGIALTWFIVFGH